MDAAVGVNGEESGRTTDLPGRPGHMEGVLWHLEVRPGRRRPAIGQHDLGLKHGGIFAFGDDPRLLLHSQPIEDTGPGGMVLEQALHLRLGVALSNLDGCDLPRWMRRANIAGLLMLCVRRFKPLAWDWARASGVERRLASMVPCGSKLCQRPIKLN